MKLPHLYQSSVGRVSLEFLHYSHTVALPGNLLVVHSGGGQIKPPLLLAYKGPTLGLIYYYYYYKGALYS
jgi:hypothetical protein